MNYMTRPESGYEVASCNFDFWLCSGVMHMRNSVPEIENSLEQLSLFYDLKNKHLNKGDLAFIYSQTRSSILPRNQDLVLFFKI